MIDIRCSYQSPTRHCFVSLNPVFAGISVEVATHSPTGSSDRTLSAHDGGGDVTPKAATAAAESNGHGKAQQGPEQFPP